MAFDAEFAAVAAGDLLSELGETVSYTPSGGSAADITAVFEPMDDAVGLDDDRAVRELRATLHVAEDDVAVVTPDKDIVVVGGVRWTVRAEKDRVGGLRNLELTASATRARGRTRER